MERAAAVVVAGTGLVLLVLAALVFAGPDVADRHGGVDLAAVVTGTPRPTVPATVSVPPSAPVLASPTSVAAPAVAGIPAPLAALLSEISAGGIRFELDRADLDEEACRLLDRLAAMLVIRPDLLVVVRGHTDNTGGPDVNGPLSVLRGQVVADYLVAHGVPGGQLEVVGVAADEPVADNATDEGRRANRRSEISTVESAG